jgi:NADPH-dependent 2,4-dienoyl-CoA reductase/sulfur reductase-like enzyme
MIETDIIILGAGPAGMAAARTAAEAGADVHLIDEQTTGGGQIYRAIKNAGDDRIALLGPAYKAGMVLVEGLAHNNIHHHPGATIWRVDDDGMVCFSVAQKAQQIRGRHVIIATGALERAMPIPGWTLPGVLTVGAAQILVKTSGVAVEGAILAGSGPLLYLVAAQLIRAGCPPKALVETQNYQNYLAASRHIKGAFRNLWALAEGWSLLREIRRAGIPRYTGASALRVLGSDRATGMSFASGGQQHQIDSETVLLHAGVVPNTQISRSLRLDHLWDKRQYCFSPRVDEWGSTSRPLFSVAGDGGGIGGAKAAAEQGHLAALFVLVKLELMGIGDAQTKSAIHRSILARELAIRPFLDALYAPAKEIRQPANNTIICRCEEVTAGEIRAHAKSGCLGPNQAKAFSRAGMGPCQGRYCGQTVTEILAAENGLTPQQTGAYRIRAPIKPISLGELADLNPE